MTMSNRKLLYSVHFLNFFLRFHSLQNRSSIMHSLMYVHRVSWSFNFKPVITFKPHSLPMKCYIRGVSGVTGQAAPDYRKGCRYFATSSIPSSNDPIITNVPEASKIPWYKKVFLREFASRTYDESKFIDFDEESRGDYYVPLKYHDDKIDSLNKEIASLNKEIASLNQLIGAKDHDDKIDSQNKEIASLNQLIGAKDRELEIKINDLVFVRCRCQVEVFLDDYGQAADIDKSTLPKSLSRFERTRRIRALNIAWILKNRQDEWRVHNLHRLIEKSEHFKGDVDLFADALSTGYDDLSRIIKRRVLIPGTGDLSYKYAATDEHANRAIETFMDLFEIKDFVTVKKK